MSRSSATPDDSAPNVGLEDPRTIHPAPENVFPKPGEVTLPEPSSESDRASRNEDSKPSEAERGIVDPRNEVVGPDIE